MRHLTTDTLLNHIENTEDSADRAAWTVHLGSCASCQEKAEELQELVSLLSRDAANEPPADLVQWGVQLFQPVLSPKENPLRRLVGRLVFDSFLQPATAGVRHVGAAPRQLLFKAGDVDVDLRIESGLDDRISVAGQVLSSTKPFFDDTPVRLESHGVVRYKTRTNPVGEFIFDEVPPDTYHLSMDLPEGQVTLFCVYRAEPSMA